MSSNGRSAVEFQSNGSRTVVKSQPNGRCKHGLNDAYLLMCTLSIHACRSVLLRQLLLERAIKLHQSRMRPETWTSCRELSSGKTESDEHI